MKIIIENLKLLELGLARELSEKGEICQNKLTSSRKTTWINLMLRITRHKPECLKLAKHKGSKGIDIEIWKISKDYKIKQVADYLEIEECNGLQRKE